jgi:hypothetical protein
MDSNDHFLTVLQNKGSIKKEACHGIPVIV